MKPTFFLMIISGRSGSSYLRALLNQDPRLVMLGEMLVGKQESRQKEIIDNFFQGKMGNYDYSADQAAIGFKTKLNDVSDRPNFLGLIKQHKPKIIINRRRNFLRQAISRSRMLVLLDNTLKKYGKEHHSPKHQDDIVAPIEVDVNWIYRTARNFEQRDRELADFANSLNNQVETIYYEDFADNPTVAIDLLSETLGIDIKIKDYNITYKNTSNDLRQAISNYAELKRRLENTKYSSML